MIALKMKSFNSKKGSHIELTEMQRWSLLLCFLMWTTVASQLAGRRWQWSMSIGPLPFGEKVLWNMILWSTSISGPSNEGLPLSILQDGQKQKDASQMDQAAALVC